MTRKQRVRFYTDKDGKLRAVAPQEAPPPAPLKRKPVYRPALWLCIAALIFWGSLGWALWAWWPR